MLFLPQQPSTLALMHWQKLCEKVHKIWYYQSCIQLLAIVLCKVSSLVATPGKKLVFAGTALGDGEGVPKLWIFIFYSGKVPQLCVQYLPGYSGLSSCIIMGDFNAGMEIIDNYTSWNGSSMMIEYGNIPLSWKCRGMVINWPLNNIWEITSINQWTHSSRCLGLSIIQLVLQLVGGGALWKNMSPKMASDYINMMPKDQENVSGLISAHSVKTIWAHI